MCQTKLSNVYLDKISNINANVKVKNFTDLHLTKLTNYDLKICNGICDRHEYMKRALTHPGAISRVCFLLNNVNA